MTNESSGGLNASSASGYGGVIDIVGSNIEVKNARINAQGKKHGGLVRIGGDLQGGKNSNQNYDKMLASQNVKNKLKNSEVVEIDEKSLIDVSSSEGRGGVAIVWSENLTKFSGSIIATGEKISL